MVAVRRRETFSQGEVDFSTQRRTVCLEIIADRAEKNSVPGRKHMSEYLNDSNG